MNDGNELVITETAGTPGYDFDFTFGEYDTVPTTALAVQFYAYYDGNLAHNVKLQQWDYNASGWVDVPGATFPDETSEQHYRFVLIDDPDYISGGEIKLRIVHTSPGNPTHHFHIDQMYLELAGKAEVLFKGMGRGMFRKMR